MINKTKNKLRNRGFTVLETLVSIAVVSLAISGASLAVKSGLSAGTLAKEQVKAFYLAQEAIEVIRNKRDANLLNNILTSNQVSWISGIAQPGDPCSPGNTCYVDAMGPGNVFFYACSGSWNSCPFLKQNVQTNDVYSFMYGYNFPNTSIYRREIQIEQNSVNEITITVRVSWSHGALNREFKTKTTLNNWI